MLSERLKQIIDMIPDGVGVADIGTDHAMIPLYLARHTGCQPIIAGEKNPGPYKRALTTVRENGLEERIQVRKGSGFLPLDPGEVDWAIIAGMGPRTIMEIFKEAEEIVRSLEGIILQPMQKPATMRRWLLNNGYQIVDEVIVKEEGKLFHIIQTRSGQPEQVDEIFYEVGPILFTKNESYVKEHLEKLISSYQLILKKVSPEEGVRARKRIEEVKKKIEKLEEVYKKWQKKFSE